MINLIQRNSCDIEKTVEEEYDIHKDEKVIRQYFLAVHFDLQYMAVWLKYAVRILKQVLVQMCLLSLWFLTVKGQCHKNCCKAISAWLNALAKDSK